jgi:protein O-GlcNAcase / histone acetyltransferase
MHEDCFLSGVVEGFYGRPWTHGERLRLLDQLAALQLNTYFYAPKDDLKHRAIWRELYDEAELRSLCEVIDACRERGLNFIYGLSPGLDIRFADATEKGRIEARFEQLRRLGVQHFALLFDDLPGNLNDEDRSAFYSLAAAQCHVANAVFQWLRADTASARLLFCPTPYCERMDQEQLGGAGYLDELGGMLGPEIDVLWTGPEIVSEEIAVDSIERLSRRIGRRPVIWDNLFANDYDLHRLHTGPYVGRRRELKSAVQGILLNPNNEYAINFIPLRSFAAYLDGDGTWDPRATFLGAIAEWLPSFATVLQPLALDDLILLADCFYLPHIEGPEACRLLHVIQQLFQQPVAHWGDAYEHFSSMNRRIQASFERLTELRDRELFYAWSRHAWALKEYLQSIDAELARRKTARHIAVGPQLYLTGTCRGGLLAKLERVVTGVQLVGTDYHAM